MNIAQSIIYEDKEIIICNKEAGWLSQSDKSFAVDMVSALRTYRMGKGEDSYIAILNRLDRPVSGLVLFAKTKERAAALTKEMQNNHINKYYYAVICGKPEEPKGTFVDYLIKDGKSNSSSVTKDQKNGKRAELEYEVLADRAYEDGVRSLVRIHLKTGRHHQIRVQFASRNYPLYGDAKYNPNSVNGENIALCAYQLEVGKKIYNIEPSGGAFADFVNEIG